MRDLHDLGVVTSSHCTIFSQLSVIVSVTVTIAITIGCDVCEL